MMKRSFGTPRACVISYRPKGCDALISLWPRIARDSLKGAVEAGSLVHVSPFSTAIDIERILNPPR